MIERTEAPRTLVLAVGPTAARSMPELGRRCFGGVVEPSLLGLSAEFPPTDLGRWQDFVYDLGWGCERREMLDWCRRLATRLPDPYGWSDPMESRRLDPGQCRRLFDFHQSHGLLRAFWRASLPRRISTLHIVTALSDGAASLLPEILNELQPQLDGAELVHVHAVAPAPAGTPVVSGNRSYAYAGHSLERLAVHSRNEAVCPQLFWILHYGAERYDRLPTYVIEGVAQFAVFSDQDPLRDYCNHLRRLQAWRKEVVTVWGAYWCVHDDNLNEAVLEQILSDEWVDYGLPAGRLDLMRRVLIDWGARDSYRKHILSRDPGLKLIDAVDRRQTSPALCKAYLGFQPSELPDWKALVSSVDGNTG